ncbi:MAG: hypothetical protein LBQ15_07620 [Clostridium sp.]|jgi:hypothetical protein|nr:hypothetical protein [Clostridium sp.]
MIMVQQIEKDLLIDFSMPDYWERFICHTRNYQNYISLESYSVLKELIARYPDTTSFYDYSLKRAIQIPDDIILLFFRYIYRMTRPQCVNRLPIHCRNGNWMKDIDYCFLNIRCLGKGPNEVGNILNAMKALLTIRATGIHLAPFYECCHGIVYCQKSFYRINSDILVADENCVKVADQLKIMIECAHMLGKIVGFDFTPHTCHLSKLSFDRPELFR